MVGIRALIFLTLLGCCSCQCPHIARSRRQISSMPLQNLPGPLNVLEALTSITRPNDSNTETLLREAGDHAFRLWTERTTQDLLTFLRGSSLPPTRDLFPSLSGLGERFLQKQFGAFVIEEISRFVGNRTGDVEGLERISLRNTSLEFLCEPIHQCDPEYVYRTSNGSCNNLQHTSFGMALGPVNRYLPYAYVDGISSAKGSDRPLPNARRISFSVFTSRSQPMMRVNPLWTTMGQILAHDFIGSAFPLGTTGLFAFVECCTPENLRNPELRHPDCMPIPIPENDPFYTQYAETCMQFQRHVGSARQQCNLGPRQHMSVSTSFIDTSHVHGNEDDAEALLRSFAGGRLRTNVIDGREYFPNEDGQLLPSALQDTACIADESNPRSICALTGHFVNGETPVISGLSLLQTRQHNYFADRLAELNPHWDDERLFREARKIVSATFQVATYKEYLPVTVGPEFMETYNLTVLENGYFYGYDPEVNPGLVDEFGVAVFRLGHTTVPDRWALINYDGELIGEVNVRDVLTRPINASEIDPYLIGNTRIPALAVDNSMTIELSNHLFPRRDRPGGTDEPFGLDLAALNIQRGRDHALQSYNSYRRFCGFNSATTFDDLRLWMPEDAVRRIRSVYQDVEDVELFVGSMSESPVPGGVVGPTVACLVSEQFRRMKVGDRFYYENGGFRHSFTTEQLQEIRKFSLSSLVCDFSDNIQQMQLQTLLIPSETNPIVSCDDERIQRIDLQSWKEEVQS